MDRWGCVDVPALPLQLLLRREPDWQSRPVAVVDEDRPQGRILWVNEHARRSRILPGRRYAAGLALAADLRAGVVAPREIAQASAALLEALRAFSPEVEPAFAEGGEPGLFWLNASGIEGLFPSASAWARSIVETLRRQQLAATVVVGYSRFGSYALARAGRGVRVLTSPREERRLADRVPLHRLQLEPRLRDALSALGIEDVGGFRRLPPGGVRARFGAEAHALHRLAQGQRAAPLAPAVEEPAAEERFELDPEQHELDVQGLLFLLKQRLAQLVQRLGGGGRAIAALSLRLLFEKAPPRDERVSPAEPTLDERQLLELLRLRLSALQLGAEVQGFELRAETVAATAVQRSLFRAAPKRNLDAGNRALARLRAEFGDDAVVCAERQPGHLPEARFVWRPLRVLRAPQPGDVAHPRLVRRILAQPQPLSSPRAEPDGWYAGGLECGPIYNLFGPYVISGGWWRREQHREYYFAETRRGDLLWIYFDRTRRQWFWQGVVE